MLSLTRFRALSNNSTLRTFLTASTRNEQIMRSNAVIPVRNLESPIYEMFRELEDFFPSSMPSGRPNFVDRSFLEHFRPRLLGGDGNPGVRIATPRYEITENDSEFKLAIDVPGVKAGDMKIKLEQDGRVLRLTGERKIQDGNWTSECNFEKAFLLDKKIQTDKITANLSDGVVIITAPKVLIEQKNDIQIPITEINRAAISEGEEAEDEINISTGKK
jgi:HSP20 family protein